MAKISVLVVEDEAAFLRLIKHSLAAEGFEVHGVPTGAAAIDLASEIHPDAVILDLNLPDRHGFDVLAELRERSDVPVILVTGARTTDDIRAGLDHGADDYLTKPFSPQELAARVRAVLRSRRRTGRRHQVGAAIVDLDARTIEAAEGGATKAPAQSIGRGGWRLLEFLLGNEGRVLYHDELLDAAFGPEYRGDGSYLQDQVRRLRRGLGIPPWSEGPIRTVAGVGYVYDPLGEIPASRPRRPRDGDPMTEDSGGQPAPTERAGAPG
jgi:two-component system, OmpR family, KDP operon response regulator KdpE